MSANVIEKFAVMNSRKHSTVEGESDVGAILGAQYCTVTWAIVRIH
ncbi:hypothetical protein ACMZ6Z_03715 [Streptococcus pluranimalium]